MKRNLKLRKTTVDLLEVWNEFMSKCCCERYGMSTCLSVCCERYGESTCPRVCSERYGESTCPCKCLFAVRGMERVHL